MMKKIFALLAFSPTLAVAQQLGRTQNDVTTPLHLMQPDYETPYVVPTTDDITNVLDRIYNYLDTTTPTQLVDSSGADITDYSKVNAKTKFKPADFRLTSYEWGVTYTGMLLATEATGNDKYAEYSFSRMKFLADIRLAFQKVEQQSTETNHIMTSFLHPQALDDCGAICASLIKAERAGIQTDLNPMIDNFINFISNKQQRLDDGTLARNRPLPNSLWLDDLFMSVPALAQMGKYTGQTKYYDDAVKQVLQFSKRMFNYDKGLFMHGWIQEMTEHPQFHWARANGWAVMTMIELLDVLPADYANRDQVLELLKCHIRGLADFQSAQGFWHQLIDRNDSYHETSATAIYAYSIARAINRGYIDDQVYGPMVCLAWNAVASKVTEKGQVEGTCVGTGMGFDPAYYYYRPINVFAAHGYGPVLLAGAEIIEMLKNHFPKMNDSAIQFYSKEITTSSPIFEGE